ncbi:hypothetical protein SERLADRAFT_386103 [Serpula lacrymans var. lacrymans S7.9]|uniref:Uncharacterized protein n=1 Tax=Serpula lacrymans var. lacrymans (strain S7.9) TaxID=578457 RepID=F8NS30_SERL9|nr:uncharacterized protein SERLADRAFT_386103 [Serpula lacrymans var. lacrymans S7.9]EGO26863.1 hypothetical protein SERLADRAFT_386103 [Serpula lacrymans var. lacrymans S7.9]
MEGNRVFTSWFYNCGGLYQMMLSDEIPVEVAKFCFPALHHHPHHNTEHKINRWMRSVFKGLHIPFLSSHRHIHPPLTVSKTIPPATFPGVLHHLRMLGRYLNLQRTTDLVDRTGKMSSLLNVYLDFVWL